MIFVIVGTHEQPFNRLVEYMDKWSEKKDEEVIIQTGFSSYEPKYSICKKIYGFSIMKELVENARIVITHGGPSSFIMPLQIGKIPIVVPRKKEFNEHVNNHQLVFAKAVEKKYKNIIVVEDIISLDQIINDYSDITKDMKNTIRSNNSSFCEMFNMIVEEIM